VIFSCQCARRREEEEPDFVDNDEDLSSYASEVEITMLDGTREDEFFEQEDVTDGQPQMETDFYFRSTGTRRRHLLRASHRRAGRPV
jgi:hypothetical protein